MPREFTEQERLIHQMIGHAQTICRVQDASFRKQLIEIVTFLGRAAVGQLRSGPHLNPHMVLTVERIHAEVTKPASRGNQLMALRAEFLQDIEGTVACSRVTEDAWIELGAALLESAVTLGGGSAERAIQASMSLRPLLKTMSTWRRANFNTIAAKIALATGAFQAEQRSKDSEAKNVRRVAKDFASAVKFVESKGITGLFIMRGLDESRSYVDSASPETQVAARGKQHAVSDRASTPTPARTAAKAPARSRGRGSR